MALVSPWHILTRCPVLTTLAWYAGKPGKTRTRSRETVGSSQKEGLKEEEEEEEMFQNLFKKIVVLIILIIIKPCTLVHILLTSWTSPVIGTLAEETTECVHTSASVPGRCKTRYKNEVWNQ